jgi:hypothetical protein
LNTFLKDMGFRSKQDYSKRTFQTVFMAAGENETTKENVARFV